MKQTLNSGSNQSSSHDDAKNTLGVEAPNEGDELLSSTREDILLWEKELEVREQVASSPFSGNFVGAFCVNTYAAMHILVVYLISLESLLSIALSVGLTVCKFNTKPVYMSARLLRFGRSKDESMNYYLLN